MTSASVGDFDLSIFVELRLQNREKENIKFSRAISMQNQLPMTMIQQWLVISSISRRVTIGKLSSRSSFNYDCTLIARTGIKPRSSNSNCVRGSSGGSGGSRNIRQRVSQKISEKSDTQRKNILPLEIVESSKVQGLLPVIGNASYIALASGFLLTDMLQLRLFLVGGYTGLVLFHLLHRKPLRIPLRWSGLFVLVNCTAAFYLMADRYAGNLSEQEEVLYREHFNGLTRGQFRQLLALGERQEVPDGKVLTVEGVVGKFMYFIEKGKAKVYHHQAFVSNINQGGFINDVAYNQGPGVGAYGTVLASGNCSLIVWDVDILRNYLNQKSDMNKNMKYCLSDHLVKSLLEQREAAHERQIKANKEKYTANIVHRKSRKYSKENDHIRNINKGIQSSSTIQPHLSLKRSHSENQITWVTTNDDDQNNIGDSNNDNQSNIGHGRGNNNNKKQVINNL